MVFPLVVLGMVCCVHEGCSQGTLTALYLFISGSGSVTPLQNGQLIEAGQSYEMTAVPDPGFAFSSWQPVNVFTLAQTNFDGSGNPILPPVVSTVANPVPSYTFQPVLDFTMQAEQEVTPDGSNPSIVEDFGWQANFVPIPEPSAVVLVLGGFTAAVFLRRNWSRCLTLRWSQRQVRHRSELWHNSVLAAVKAVAQL
jgi:hypothetical protein